jgi:hypothetical protein
VSIVQANSHTTWDYIATKSNAFARTITSLDVSAASGNYYIRVHAYTGAGSLTSNVNVYSIYYRIDDDLYVVAPDVLDEEHIVEIWNDETDFGIDIDGIPEDSVSGGHYSVYDNSNNWVLSMPYFDYYQHRTSDTLRLTYEPDDIISGTALLNEENPGTYDGAITFGSNPVGIDVTIGGLVSSSQQMPSPNIPSDQPTPDIIEPTGVSDVVGGFGTLEDNPLYPIVKVIGDLTNIPVPLVWVLGSLLILLIAMGICFASVPHQLITGIVGIGLTYLFYAMGIFPWWTLIVMGCVLVALLMYERKPAL